MRHLPPRRHGQQRDEIHVIQPCRRKARGRHFTNDKLGSYSVGGARSCSCRLQRIRFAAFFLERAFSDTMNGLPNSLRGWKQERCSSVSEGEDGRRRI